MPCVIISFPEHCSQEQDSKMCLHQNWWSCTLQNRCLLSEDSILPASGRKKSYRTQDIPFLSMLDIMKTYSKWGKADTAAILNKIHGCLCIQDNEGNTVP